MSRILTATGNVGTLPEAKHGKGADFVKFRFSTKEYGESDTWWFNVLCYGRDAKIALDKFKVGDYLMVTGRLLPPIKDNQTDGTIIMVDFKWLRQEASQSQQSSDAVDDFDFGAFEDIPEIPFGS